MTLAASIESGIRALCSRQAPPGFWSDWRLPPGDSRMWTTAYIGYRLSSLPPGRLDNLGEHLDRADAWLRSSQMPGGGWGYTDTTGPDADTTALALLFLRRRGGVIGAPTYLSLGEHQRPDGGFSTYSSARSHGSWIRSHPDVSAVAVHALLLAPEPPRDRITRGLNYLRGQQREDGLWNAFWWTSCLYATEATLACFHVAGEPLDRARLAESLCRVPAVTPFESALLVLGLARLGAISDSRVHAHVHALVSGQAADGLWPGGAILCLTRRDITEPWAERDPGPLFRDERGLFTTATAVSALAAFEDRLGAQ